MSTTPLSSEPSPEPPPNPRGWRRIAAGIGGVVLASTLLWWFGRPLWDTYRDYRQISQEAETSAPIGYVGVSLRRTYFDKPIRFFDASTGRKRLWAAKGADGKPEFYDVTDAELRGRQGRRRIRPRFDSRDRLPDLRPAAVRPGQQAERRPRRPRVGLSRRPPLLSARPAQEDRGRQ